MYAKSELMQIAAPDPTVFCETVWEAKIVLWRNMYANG